MYVLAPLLPPSVYKDLAGAASLMVHDTLAVLHDGHKGVVERRPCYHYVVHFLWKFRRQGSLSVFCF